MRKAARRAAAERKRNRGTLRYGLICHVDYGPVPARSATAQEMKHRSAPLAMLNALRRTGKCFAPVW